MKNQSSDPHSYSLGKLFVSMLYISTFTFGGGFVIVSLMKKKFVDEMHWLEEDEMLDMTALAQSAPGAIAVNGAILVGRRLGGLRGMAVAVLGTILPPMVILSIISVFYQLFAANVYVAALLGGMQAGVAAVVTDVVLSLGSRVVREKKPVQIGVMLAAFVAGSILKINVIYIILASAAVGVVLYLAEKRGAKA